ncbi:O-antigen polymerase [Halarcobacter sp.]|uniref:O-antigen polymerase n=1 Tax=Halarcobacter sp. TaxID=2321133 RepID=UPI003A8E1578
MMRILIIWTLLIGTLFSKNIENDKEYSCLQFNEKEICIKRGISPNKYQNIYINDIYIAHGNTQIPNTTYAKGRFWKNSYIHFSTNWISFFIEDKIFLYNLKEKQFYKFEDFKEETIYNVGFFKDNLLFIQYYSKKTQSLDIQFVNLSKRIGHKVNNTGHDILRKFNLNRNLVIDRLIDKSFIPNYVQKIKGSAFDIIPTKLNNKYSKHFKSIKTFYFLNKNKDDFLSSPILKNESYILNSKLEIISSHEFNYNKVMANEFKDNISFFVHNKYFSILILLISIVSLAIVYFLVRKSVGTYKLPFISSFFMLSYICFVFIGATLLNAIYFEYEYSMYFYERKDILFNVWKYALYGLFLIPFGFIFANYLLKFDVKRETEKFTNIKYNNEISSKIFFIIISLFLISFIILFIYINKLSTLPIMGLFNSLSMEELAQLRSLSGNDFDGKVYRYMIFIKLIPLILLLISFTQFKINNKWKVLFLLLLGFNIFVNIMDLSKAPIINLFLTLLLMYFYLKGYINWKYVLIFSLFSFILLVLLYLVTFDISIYRIFNILSDPFHRAFIGSITPLFYWQLYVEQYGLLNGATLSNPAGIFPFHHLPISLEIMNFAHPEFLEVGIVGSMPVVFFGDWFINFGWSWALFSMILFGFLIRVIDILIIKKMNKVNTGILLSLYVYFIFFFKSFSVTTFFGIYVNPNFVLPIILTVLLLLIEKSQSLTSDK